jgi:steroid delta-isomerase-like uncharacterized protein
VTHADVVRRYFDELLNGPEPAVADEILTEDFVFRAGREVDHGPEEFKQHVQRLHERFPGLRYELHDQIVEGDRIAAHITMHGTHGAELMGFPATGKPFAVPAVNLFGLHEGRIREILVVSNMLELLRQIGASPPGQPWRAEST